jgi:hypothetical protein
MDESDSGCWTNQCSIVEYQGLWYLFYHDRDLSPDFDKNRSVRADVLTFNQDGTINKVIPTLRGVGIANARSKIQIDRYSAISKQGASVAFLDYADKHEGWKVSFNDKDAWVRYDRVDFGNDRWKSVNIRLASSTGGTMEIRLDTLNGPVLARVDVGKGSEWNVVKSSLLDVPSGVHNLFVSVPEQIHADVDWISFE